LEIKFPFPDQYPHYTIHPARYITHAIGHEGSGSILSLLKKKGWANNLAAGTSHGGIGFEFYKITVDLTKEGLAHYEDVTLIIFQYIEMLRREGVRPYIWDEVCLGTNDKCSNRRSCSQFLRNLTVNNCVQFLDHIFGSNVV
jgi:insulysin